MMQIHDNYEIFMSNSNHYDVIIVGAGPAGSCTAMYIHPNRTGKRVLLLEGKKQVGIPMQCGEAMPTYAAIEHFPRCRLSRAF
jgi:flavin-dependent dehydrogenase